MRRFLILFLMFMIPSLEAEPEYNQVAATATTQTLTFLKVVRTVHIYNQGSDEIYIRWFTDADTAGPSTTSYYALPATTAIRLTHTSEEGGTGYLHVSIVCDTGETATVDVLAK